MTMKRLNSFIIMFILIFFVSVLPICFSPNESAEAGKKMTEAEYKAACKKLEVGLLTKKADQYKGKMVTFSGQILMMDLPKETKTGKTPYGIIISVKDDTHTLPSGVLPVYLTYYGTTDSFIYDNIRIYGKVYGNHTYKSVTIQEKVLPRVDAKYLEKVN